MTDKKSSILEDRSIDSDKPITSNELEYILDVNKKAISIYIEVEKQNEDIISELKDISEKFDSINLSIQDGKSAVENLNEKLELTLIKSIDELSKKVISIDKNLWKLAIFFSTVGAGTVIDVIMRLLHK